MMMMMADSSLAKITGKICVLGGGGMPSGGHRGLSWICRLWSSLGGKKGGGGGLMAVEQLSQFKGWIDTVVDFLRLVE